MPASPLESAHHKSASLTVNSSCEGKPAAENVVALYNGAEAR
ncbi:hypothetical protein [Hyphomonas sediminis]|nr:hypothetical protein [Hyphomonas sediminis]